jgi:hypothetical protein
MIASVAIEARPWVDLIAPNVDKSDKGIPLPYHVGNEVDDLQFDPFARED